MIIPKRITQVPGVAFLPRLTARHELSPNMVCVKCEVGWSDRGQKVCWVCGGAGDLWMVVA